MAWGPPPPPQSRPRAVGFPNLQPHFPVHIAVFPGRELECIHFSPAMLGVLAIQAHVGNPRLSKLCSQMFVNSVQLCFSHFQGYDYTYRSLK